MELLITIIVAILSGLSFVAYKQPEISANILYKTFIFWSALMILIAFFAKFLTIELTEIINELEDSIIDNPLDKFGSIKAIKIINLRISQFEKMYKYCTLSVFIMGIGLGGIYFFSKLLVAHNSKTDKANDKPDTSSNTE